MRRHGDHLRSGFCRGTGVLLLILAAVSVRAEAPAPLERRVGAEPLNFVFILSPAGGYSDYVFFR